jgi:hypothetical protein
MAEQDEGDFGHIGNGLPVYLVIVYILNRQGRLNKHAFFDYLNGLDRVKAAKSGQQGSEAGRWAFPEHG